METRLQFPSLTVASFGAQLREKLGGKITARASFGGTHGIAVNHRKRIRGQEAFMVLFVLCSVAVLPLSWSKTAGGDTVSWVLGPTERRAQ